MANVKEGDLALIIKGLHGSQLCPCMIGRAIVRIKERWRGGEVDELAWKFEDPVPCRNGFAPVGAAVDRFLMRIDGPEPEGYSTGDKRVSSFVADMAHLRALRRSFEPRKKTPSTSKASHSGCSPRGKR